jgi:hypothetical protein
LRWSNNGYQQIDPLQDFFCDSEEKQENGLEKYIGDSRFEIKIRRAAAFFSIIIQD